MLYRSGWLAATTSVLTVACQAGETAPLDSDVEKASYALGFDIGTNFQPSRQYLDLDALMRGIEDALEERELEPSFVDSIVAARRRVGEQVQIAQLQARQELMEKNLAEGEAFLAENATREGVTVTESGLQYEVLTQGDGPRPAADAEVRVHYRGTLIDGREFDSSYGRGEPSEFAVDRVVPGFSEGLQLMPVGSHYRFYIPPDIGYGQQAAGSIIGPNSTLIFEVELQEIL